MADRWGKMETVTDFIFLVSKITVYGDCRHKIKIHLLLGRKTMISLLLFSHLVMFNTLWSHGLQHTGFPCPSPSPRACLNSHPLSQWWHPTILSSVVPFSSCLQSFPESRSFQWVSSSHQVAWYWSFSFIISPSNEYLGLISFRIDWLHLHAIQGTLKSLFQH